MKQTITFLTIFLAGIASIYAQDCYDEVGYVASKNIGGTTMVDLAAGNKFSLAQTYHYNSKGEISKVRVYGDNPHFHNHLMRVAIYNVDVNNRPTTLIAENWRNFPAFGSYMDVSFPSVAVTANFALVVERGDFTSPTSIKHTGNDGVGEDLTSYRTFNGNWQSLGLGGDLYIIPYITNNNNAGFTMNSQCIVNGGNVAFTNTSNFTTARMFNQITEAGYMGGETLYSWDFGGLGTSTLQNPSFNFNTSGVHTITLTTTIDDWNGSLCQDSYSMQVSVGLDVIGSGTNLSCYHDGSGEIDVTGLFGAPPYSYNLNGGLAQTGTNFSSLDAGIYAVNIHDALGCTSTDFVTITEPAEMKITLPINTTLATCGNSDGAFVAYATGGVGTISYSIDNSSFQSNGSFTGLLAGVYTIYLMDAAQGCIDSSYCVAVNNTASPSLSLVQYITIACHGDSNGEITVLGSGGTGALQYSINNGETWQASGIFTGLEAGMYVPIVKDAAGCIGSFGNVNLTQPNELKWKVSQVPTTCSWTSNGQIHVGPVSGGTGTMSYSINGVNFQSGSNFSGLAAGLYTVTVKDATGCISTATITVTSPAPIVVLVDAAVNLSCFESGDGELHVSATGGNGNYSYWLSTGGWATLGGVQSNGNFYDLQVGTYLISVTDGNGCLGTMAHTITQPTEILASVVTGNSTCGNSNGNILIIASGGSGSGYVYDLNEGLQINGSGNFLGLPSDEFGINVVDGNGCEASFSAIISDSDGPSITASTFTDITCHGGNDGSITILGTFGGTGTIQYSIDGSNFQTSNVFTGLSAGIYPVIIRDAVGCTGEMSVTLNEPAAFTILLNDTDLSCYGGSNGTVSVSAGGGQGTLAYSIDGVNFQSSPIFNNLSIGVTTVTVKDAGGCIGTASTYISSPFPIQLSVGVLMVSCYGTNNGALNATASGGTGLIEYSLNGINYQPIGYFNNLAGNFNYVVYARDANGCVASLNFTITQPADLSLSYNLSDVSCAGGNDGVIDLSMSGGTPPYSFQWSNLITSEDLFNLTSALYSVNVTDANGCVTTHNFFVDEPANPIIVNGAVTNASASATANGIVDVTISGGVAPYTFEWNTGATSEDLINVLPGSYLVTVTDANGCEQTSLYTVQVSADVKVVFSGALNIYPNPARDVITIDLGSSQAVERIILTDPAGKVVFEDTPNSSKFDVNVQFYAEGVYFINLYVGDEVIVRRIAISE